MASQSTITVTPSAYTMLGAGPWLVEALDNPVRVAISDSQPAAGSPGIMVYPGQPLAVNATALVWASALSGTARLTYGQVALGGGGGGGGTVNVAVAITGGWSVYSAPGGTGNAALTNSAVAVKAAPGNLGGFVFDNSAGTQKAYVQIFDATAVTLGTTVPKLVVPVAAGGYWEEKFADVGVTFSTGIIVAATATPTGNGAPSSPVLATIYYA